jgi:hypothetical protein
MSKNIKKIKNQFNLCNDLIDIFTDYAFCLDNYFKIEKNKVEHLDLYNEYKILNVNLKNAIRKNGFDK